MFTLGSFSVFFWTLAGIILIMLIFEDKLLAIEEEYDKKKVQKKKAKAQNRNNSRYGEEKRVSSTAGINKTNKNINRNFAA